MIDYFAIALTHGLILVAMWRILFRPELDDEEADAKTPVKPWLRNQNTPAAAEETRDNA